MLYLIHIGRANGGVGPRQHTPSTRTAPLSAWYALALGPTNVVKSRRASNARKKTWINVPQLVSQYDFQDKEDDLCSSIVVGGGGKPIYRTPTNSYQLWVNQFVEWRRLLFPEKRSLSQNKTLTELASTIWNDAKGEVGQLMSLMIDQGPVTPQKEVKPPAVQIQKRLGSYWEKVVKETPPLVVESKTNTPNIQHNTNCGSNYDLSNLSEEHQSPMKPMCNTGGDKALMQCPSNAAEVMPVVTVPRQYYDDYLDRTTIPSDRFLCWLLGEEFLEWMPKWLKKKSYNNNRFNGLVRTWVNNDFSQLEKEYSAGQIRKSKRSSRTSLCVLQEIKGRAVCKYAVQKALEAGKDEGIANTIKLDWLIEFQTACDIYDDELLLAIPVMKKSVLNRKAHRNKHFQIDGLNKTFKIKMNNNADVSWKDVNDRLRTLAEFPDKTSNTMSPLLPSQLLKLGEKIKDGMLFVQSNDEFLEEVASGLPQDDVIQAIGRCFPVIVLQCASKTVVVDLHAMRTNEDWMELIWLDEEQKESDKPSKSFLANTWAYPLKPQSQSKPKPGRQPLHAKFPSIPNIISDYIKGTGSVSANDKRRETTGNSGMFLNQVRSHVLSKLPLLASWGVGLKVLHYQYKPPDKRFNASKKYRGEVDMKVPHKKNNLRKANPNAHAVFAQVKYMKEMAAEFHDFVVETSLDGKCKIPVGKVSVDRRCNIRSFFMQDDGPDNPDHDYRSTTTDNLLTLEGILVLKKASKKNAQLAIRDEESKDILDSDVDMHCPFSSDVSDNDDGPSNTCSNALAMIPSTNCNYLKDDLGRLHIPHFCNGKLYANLRANKFIKVTPRQHYNDMSRVLTQEMKNSLKKHLCMCTDGGSDYTVSINVNLFFLFKLFVDFKLESLTSYQNAANLSAYNTVEHVWAHMNEKMIGSKLYYCLR